MKKLAVFALLSVFAILIIKCKTDQKQVRTISPPFKNLDVQSNVYIVSAEQKSEIKLNNGGSIIIPENIFVDENNKLIKGNVNINFREFHDAADIILSDMPMEYDSAGKTINFETAGMFEINGTKNNKPVFIAAGKNLTVNLGSYTDGNDYNFYKLNKDDKSWVYKGNSAPQLNIDKQLSIDTIKVKEIKKPIMPRKVNKNSQLVNLNINYNSYPELEQFHGIMWEYSGNTASMNPQNNQWIYKVKWNNMSLTEYSRDSCQYSLSLKSKDNSFKTIITPVLSKKNYEKELKKFQKKLEDYNAMLKAIADKEQMAKNEADFIRSYTVSGFGIYNWDRQMKQPNVVAINANFELDVPINMNDVTVYLVSSNERAVVKYNKYDWNSFAVSPDVDNCLIVLLPDQKVAHFSNKDFKKINFDSLRSLDGFPAYTFHLKTLDKSISTNASLKEILKSI